MEFQPKSAQIPKKENMFSHCGMTRQEARDAPAHWRYLFVCRMIQSLNNVIGWGYFVRRGVNPFTSFENTKSRSFGMV